MHHVRQGLLGTVLAPRGVDASVGASPPLSDIGVVFTRHLWIMEHRAQPTQKVSVDDLTGAFPLEIFVIQGVVIVQFMQIGGQLVWRREFVHVDVGFEGCASLIILWRCAHYDWNHIMPDKINSF